ncbi:4Fe-4S binding protein [Shewanella eurypsychrophilus]|uniref:4Fe-4S binding protein n=1 Tax=Shewanella eurypsychrophilus TaxID=2593656 RepID=A0ABX6VE64_9GAMM|nr:MULTISPECIES: 4Fe-4S binding protein [Shewanella]QFU24994.1 4Fe-4S dicluster domain-containing protein [Shewanella sp. YLB-09]QPG60170.1 4Fe-4S binding protein [Shewanella eurypsychrophilus]
MSINLKNDPQVELQGVRQQVLANTQVLQNLIPPTVSYTTEGNVLVIGPEDLARLAAGKLSNMGKLAILANESITSQDEDHLEKVMTAAEDVESFYNKLIEIKGFLGQFQVKVDSGNDTDDTATDLSLVAIRKAHFDLILDLSQSPCINLEMLPPGYFYVGQDEAKLADAISQLPDLIGEFDKPRYVKVNSEICAHTRNGIDGCNRCLNFCPADAIQSIDKMIEIDPYLCHGAGSCTNACPTGAISYDLPTPQAMHSYLHKLVTRFREQAQVAPVILFHDEANGAALITNDLPGAIIPVAMEEITVASIDHWMSSLAWGARQILVLNTAATAPTLTQMLQGELKLANDILNEMGQPQRITLIDESSINSLTDLIAISSDWPVIVPGEFASTTKRNTLYAAIDHLNEQAASVEGCLTQSNLPYGKVSVNSDSCTLCLSCVSTCPTQALTDGGDKPALNFLEQDCVQCGLCEKACPENAISLTSQMNFDKEERQACKTLKEEEPFDCIRCGTPFATKSMIERMQAVIGGHSAFSANTERLEMCSDCRVKDMFEDILQDPEKQLR